NTPAPAPAPALSCEVRGAPILPKGAGLWQSAEGNSQAATFGGQPVGLGTTSFPANGGRVGVRTSGGVRIEGFVDGAELPLFTASDIDIVPGHLWLSSGQRVTFASASIGLTVRAAVSGPIVQSFTITAPCTSFSLDKRPRGHWEVPGNGRGYLPQQSSLGLRDAPGGSVVQTLQMAQPSGVLLWSTESQGGFVRVLYHEDLVIDAWVAESEVSALTRGETMDRLLPPQLATGSARLSIAGQPTIVRAAKEVPLRLSPKDTDSPLGFIEPGGEVYALETVLGWTSVLPRALNVLPPEGRSFWVPAKEIGGR
ncbi:MAG TPA: hypothetical protein VJT73_20405, partial [Polyangiaceae bacterium]|nr:hypothetical protein [Polyangiaceae bacterium]